MGWMRDLTSHENDLCKALGEVVIFWNHVEQSFRILLQRATHISGPDGRIWSLIAHLSPVQLKDSMIALAEDHADERQKHLIHCAKMFDREREYRNHYVHGPLTFLTTESSSKGYVSAISVRGGALKHKRAEIDVEELMKFRDRLGTLQSYIGELLEDSRNFSGGKNIDDLGKLQLAAPISISQESWLKDNSE